MGKGAIIIALAALMATSALYVTQDRSSVNRIEEEVDYQEQVLAREAAESAFNIVSGKVKRDFEGYRGSYTDLPYKESEYDISAAGESDGSVTIVGTGRYGNHEVSITGSVDQSDVRLLDALTIDGQLDQFDIDNIALVSGLDTNPDGSDASGPDVHSVLAIDSDVRDQILALNMDARLIGVGGQGDVIGGQPEVDLAGLRASILAHGGATLSEYGNNRTFSNGSFGSAGTPGLMRVFGDLKLKNSFTGYGVAYVTGQLTMEDDAKWVGLIYVNNTTGAQHVMEDDASVSGVVVLRSSSDFGVADFEEEDAGGSRATICHVPPGNPSNEHTISVGQPAVSAHLAHGDYEGPCSGDDSGNGNGHGNGNGDGNSNGNGHGHGTRVDVCHIPPGNPSNAHTITISENALSAHTAHGDVSGACSSTPDPGPGDPVRMKLNGNASIIYSSQALGSLGSLFGQLALEEGQLTVSRTAERPRRLSPRMRTH